MRDTFLGIQPEEEASEQTQAYLHPKSKAPKTDRKKLKKHEILDEPGKDDNGADKV